MIATPWCFLGLLSFGGSIKEKQGVDLHNALMLLARNERLARKRAILVEEIMVREEVQVKDVCSG